MFRRVAFALAVLLTAAVAALGAAAAASADDGPTALSPSEAAALVADPGTSGVSPTVTVDPGTALAAASLPGAVTSVDPDMTLDEAVGLDPALTTPASLSRTAGSGSLTTLTAAPKICWSNSAWARWGTWPYEQKITDTTYWCAVYGSKITYRTSSVIGGGTLCGVSWRSGQLIAGGVGFPSFTMRSSAGFACPTIIPWIVLHPSHHLDVRRTDVGGSAIVGSG
jgi:hypothetical protein